MSEVETKESLEAVLEKKIPSSAVSSIEETLQEDVAAERKIEACLEAMAKSLAGEGSPQFREFWQVKQWCLPLFKEAITPKVRSILWTRYIELSAEAKRLKEILDEQSAFAHEQIELAIQAIERDLTLQESLFVACPQGIDFRKSVALKGNSEMYQKFHRQLVVFGQIASRIHALRKEVLATQMRIRIKNQCLDRLSKSADQVFPKKRSWIQELSALFQADVKQFLETHFEKDEIKKLPLHAVRKEIQLLQAAAKQLTLNVAVFAEVRKALSSSWDLLAVKSKEHRQELEKLEQAEAVERAKASEKQRELDGALNEMQALAEKAESLDQKALQEELAKVQKQLETFDKSQNDERKIAFANTAISDALYRKQVEALLGLSGAEALQEVREMHQERRSVLKERVEEYRRTLGMSNLDFEGAMLYRERIEADKKALVELSTEIDRLEEELEVLS